MKKVDGTQVTQNEFNKLMRNLDFPLTGTLGIVSLVLDLDEFIKLFAENGITQPNPNDILPLLNNYIRQESGSNNKEFYLTELILQRLTVVDRNKLKITIYFEML